MQAVEAILAVLDQVEEIINATPPVENGKSRFGNPAFRTFYDTVESVRFTFRNCPATLLSLIRTPPAQKLDELHSKIPGLDSTEAKEELGVYFRECWGNRERVDYGSGMELNFICWL